MNKLAQAFGVSKDIKEGDAFNRELQVCSQGKQGTSAAAMSAAGLAILMV